MSLAARAFPDPASLESSINLLRDRHRLFDRLRDGEEVRPILIQATLTALVGSAIFGISLGSYAQSLPQILAAGLKLPILLLGTAALSFPCFHVLQSWHAPRPLKFGPAIALQSQAVAAVALVWGSLAPPILFLVSSTQHYRLCQFLAVGVGALGGLVGLATLWSGCQALCTSEEAGEDEEGYSNTDTFGARWRLRRRLFGFLGIYFALFGVVGGQLAWMLRPFIGSPTLPFQIFRAPDPEVGNFFEMLLRMLLGV